MEQKRQGTLAESVVVFALVLGVLMYGILGLKLSAHLPLVAAIAIVTLYGRFCLGISLKELEKCVADNAKGAPFLVLLSIGVLIASWILSGTVPYLVELGLRFISPKWFLPFVLLICGMLAMVTGSAWTTCATLGVAFLAISISMGIPAGMTVAAVVGGAFFGEKQSPVSDVTAFAASVSKVDLMRHIRYMTYTSLPAIAVSLLLLLLFGLQFSGANSDLAQIAQIRTDLHAAFRLSPWALLPIVVLGIAIAKKLPGVHAMMLSAFVAIVQAVLIQKMDFQQVLSMIYGGVALNTGSETVDAICNRGGFVFMTSNLMMLVCSLGLGGVLTRTRVLAIIVEHLSPWIRSRFSLVVMTLISSSIVIFFTGSPAVGYAITGSALCDKYEEMKVDRVVLARTISDAATLQQPLVPWGASGAFVANCFGVAAMEIAPWYFVGWLMPLFALLWGLTGIGCPEQGNAVSENI